MLSSKKWGILFLLSAGIFLTGMGTVTAVIDPYFHYHTPLKSLGYLIHNERYQNDGIVKHFNYDAIITGTSMTQNFKASQLDELFDVRTIKVPFSGGSYKEINENLARGVEANPGIRLIVRGLDYDGLGSNKDDMRYPLEFYPMYLYDAVPWNDVKYVLNKSVLIEGVGAVILNTISGGKTTDFDSYGNWMAGTLFGREAFAGYTRGERVKEEPHMSEADYQRLRENLEQNVIKLAAENPQIDFYLFFTPYSIYYWDVLYREGTLRRQLGLEKEAIKILLEYDNIYLFSFFDDFDMICNPDNYTDAGHYGEWVNDQILVCMKEREHLLTKDNYQEYCDKEYAFYTAYDYDALFEKDYNVEF